MTAVPPILIDDPVARSWKPPETPGFTKRSTGLLEAPTLKSLAGTKFVVYFAFAVTIGWKIEPLNLLVERAHVELSIPTLMNEIAFPTPKDELETVAVRMPLVNADHTPLYNTHARCTHELRGIVALPRLRGPPVGQYIARVPSGLTKHAHAPLGV